MAEIDRRFALKAGIGAALAIGMPHAHAAEQSLSLDLSDPAAHLKAYQRIRTNASGRPQLWYALGTIYGKLPGQKPQPLMYGEGASYTRQVFDPQTNSLRQEMSELGYYLDIKTGQPLESWTNPFTGRSIAIRHYRVKQAQTVRVDKISGAEEGRVTVEHDGYMAAPLVHSGRVWLTEVHTTEVYLTDEAAPGRRGRKVNGGGSNATFSAAIADLLDPAQDAPPAQLFFSNMVGFMYWMEMGDSPGMMTWRALGNKLKGPDELAPAMRARIERDHSGWLENPDV